jgi:hypothetical protein
MLTITTTELLGLVTYAAAADRLAQRFAAGAFAVWLYRGSALAIVGSAVFAVFSTR